MASNRRRTIYNTRERLLSTDANDEQALLHSNLTNDTVASSVGDFFDTTVSGTHAGILSGGIVTTTVTANEVSVSPLRGFKLGAAPTSLDSPYLFLSTLASTAVDISSFVDATNDRWLCIEVSPGDSLELASTRDIFQQLLGTFIPTNVDKIRQPDPVFTVNAGAPAATPLFPLGTSGTIPLAYVYLPANNAIAIPATDIILCRPLIGSLKSSGTDPVDITGRGGVDVSDAQKPDDIECLPVSFRWDDRVRVPIGIPDDATSIVTIQGAGASNYVSTEVTPVGDKNVNVYIIAAPYPAGYDTDVAENREFIDLSGRIPSNVNGGTENGIIMVSQHLPVFALTPLSPFEVLPATVTDPVWNGGTTSRTAYVGSFAFHVTNAPTGAGAQITEGDTVRLNVINSPTATDVQTPMDISVVSASTVDNGAGSLRRMSPLGVNGYAKGTDIIMPAATEYDIYIASINDSASTAIFQRVGSDGEPRLNTIGSSTPSAADNSDANVWFYSRTASVAYDNVITDRVRVRTDNSGAINWSHEEVGAGGNTLILAVLGYRDPTLSQR